MRNRRERRARACATLLLALVVASGTAGSSPAAPPSEASEVPLIEAVRRGDVAAVRLFLDLGADPNARELVLTRPTLDNHAGWWKLVPADTALILAVKREQIPLIKLLLARGANVNGTGSDGHTPLMEACRKWRLGA